MGEGGRSWRARAAARPHAWAALTLGALVLAYLWPVLVGGKVLSANAVLYSYVPWRELRPDDVAGYLNPELIDLPLVDYPWRVLVRDLLREGTFPAWNPYALGGIPLYPNSQTGLFSPFNLPLWVLPLDYGLGVSAALKLLAGAFGTYLLVRQLRLGFLPGLVAGVAFAFSAVNITWLAHETLPGVVVMLPWALWLVERIFRRGRPGDALALALVVAIGLGGGHPGMQVHLVVVAGVYALLRVAWPPAAGGGPTRPRALALALAGVAAGVLLMAFMLVPELRSSEGTVGLDARKAGELPSSRMPFATIRTTVFPDWWGRPSATTAPVDASNAWLIFVNYCERTFYAGTVALLLAGFALVARGGWRRKAPFAAIALLGLAIAVKLPGLSWAVEHVPVVGSVEPQRLHLAYELGVAVLAAFGLQALLDAPRELRRRLAVLLAAALVGTVGLAAALALGDDVAQRLARTSVVWFLLFAAGVGLLALLAWARPRWRVPLAVAAVALAAADAYHFVDGFQPMGPPERAIPPATPSIAYLQRHRDEGRVVGLNDALPPDTGLPYGIADIRGYDPPHPTERLLRLWRLANPGQVSWQPLALHTVEARQLQILGALGVRYLVAEPGVGFSRESFPTLGFAYRGRDAAIIEQTAVAPRAFVPERVVLTDGERQTGAAIVAPGFDPRTTVAVERDQPGAAALAGAEGTVAIAHEGNATVTLEARVERRALVVLGDALTAGWSVRVDGRPAEAVHVNGVMRGVVVPAGRHEIVWSFAVPGLRLGAAVSLVALLGLAGVGVVLLRARKVRERLRPAPMLRA